MMSQFKNYTRYPEVADEEQNKVLAGVFLSIVVGGGHNFILFFVEAISNKY